MAVVRSRHTKTSNYGNVLFLPMLFIHFCTCTHYSENKNTIPLVWADRSIHSEKGLAGAINESIVGSLILYLLQETKFAT